MKKLLIVLLIVLAGTLPANAWEEGGYCGNDVDAIPVVWGFIKHFTYEQYYWSGEWQFTSANNDYVDEMDMAYFCGHGSPYEILVSDGTGGGGTWVDLSSAGSSGDDGYGDEDLEFIIFHSCQTIPSPLERADWSSGWISEPDDIFDGLHQALGFRTNASKSRDQDISDFFGARMAANNFVWQSWFDATAAHGDLGSGVDFGCAVMHPDAENDRSQTFSTDPPFNHGNLRIWYQY